MSRNRDKTAYGLAQDQGIWRRQYEKLVAKYNEYWRSINPDYVAREPVAARSPKAEDQ